VIDNVIDAVFSNVSPPTSFNGFRAIGSRNDGLAGFFNGTIDDIGIWNRALTPAEIQGLSVVNGIGLGESTLDKLTISPNPTNGLVSLNTSVIGNYELLTLDGRVLEAGTAKKDYDLTTYPKGVYHLRLSTDEGNRVLKVVKN
jgi:hypothetical protein